MQSHDFQYNRRVKCPLALSNFKICLLAQKETLMYWKSLTTYSLTLSSPRQPLIYFWSLQTCLFWTFYKSRIIQHLVFCDWLFPLWFIKNNFYQYLCTSFCVKKTFPNPYQYLFYVLIIVILVNLKEYSIVTLICISLMINNWLPWWLRG